MIGFIKKLFFSFLLHPHHSEKKPINFDNRNDFLFLQDIFSIKKHIYLETISFVIFFILICSLLIYGIQEVFHIRFTIVLSAIVAGFYLLLGIIKLFIVFLSHKNNNLIHISHKEIVAVNRDTLPMYTIIIPLYREEKVVHQIKKAMTHIDYPIEKLDIIITLEAYDHQTRNAILKEKFPDYFRILTLPDVEPKTKPKALNVAIREAKGEYIVIYDAEIIPEPTQLKKACIAFSKYPDIDCLQTRLDHYNLNHNFLTKSFNIEFSFYYDLFLPGMQKLGYPIPLSGHSTHFRKETIYKIGAWDPYNVAEDCDIGIRLYRFGGKTAVLDSISREEATATMQSWLLQRTRWMKGFIQTSIVHLRHPFRFAKEIGGWRNLFGFLLFVPGTVCINIINLLYWILIILWFATHAHIIQILFPMVILYISVASFFLGNLLFTYLNAIGIYHRRRYGLVKYALLSPFYWFLLSLASIRATIQLVIQPHYWEKTEHGHHIDNNIAYI